MNAPSRKSADNAVTGQMSSTGCSPSASPLLSSLVSEQGEREAFEAWLKTDWIGRGYPADLWSAWQARASLRASPAVPVAQDERAMFEAWVCEDLDPRDAEKDGRGRYVLPNVSAYWKGWQARAALSASTPPAVSAEARDALNDAATSLETLSLLSGRKTYGDPPIDTHLSTFMDVRLYAAARAKVAREALAAMGTQPAADNKENGNG